MRRINCRTKFFFFAISATITRMPCSYAAAAVYRFGLMRRRRFSSHTVWFSERRSRSAATISTTTTYSSMMPSLLFLLLPPRRLCFHLCPSVCLFIGLFKSYWSFL